MTDRKNAPPALPARRGVLGPIAALAPFLVLGGCMGPHGLFRATGPYAVPDSTVSGPRVMFRNDSEVPVRVRYWVGRVDITAPHGVADIRTGSHMAFTADPGQEVLTIVGRTHWLTSNHDAVVRACIEEIEAGCRPAPSAGNAEEPADAAPPGTPAQARAPKDPYWIELARPQPFGISVSGPAGQLTFARTALHEEDIPPDAAIIPVPRDQWIPDRNGPLPAYRVSEAAPRH